MQWILSGTWSPCTLFTLPTLLLRRRFILIKYSHWQRDHNVEIFQNAHTIIQCLSMYKKKLRWKMKKMISLTFEKKTKDQNEC